MDKKTNNKTAEFMRKYAEFMVAAEGFVNKHQISDEGFNGFLNESVDKFREIAYNVIPKLFKYLDNAREAFEVESGYSHDISTKKLEEMSECANDIYNFLAASALLEGNYHGLEVSILENFPTNYDSQLTRLVRVGLENSKNKKHKEAAKTFHFALEELNKRYGDISQVGHIRELIGYKGALSSLKAVNEKALDMKNNISDIDDKTAEKHFSEMEVLINMAKEFCENLDTENKDNA